MLCGSDIRAFCGVGVGSVIDDVQAWVDSIAANKAPNFQGDFSSDFTTTVRARLALFYKFEEAGSAAAPAITSYGTEAARKDFVKVQTLVDAKDPSFTPSMLTDLLTFSWLLEPRQRSAVASWADDAFMTRGQKSVKRSRGSLPYGKSSESLTAAAKIAKLFSNAK